MSEQFPIKSKQWKELVSEFRFKSDRAVVILGIAYLQTHLRRILESFFVEDAKIPAMLLEEECPLGSFSARIKAAYSLGLVSPNEFHDLLAIQSIHNEFIGEIEGVKFTDDEIRDQCFRLKIPRKMSLPEEAQTPRRLFVFATAVLAQQFMLRASQAAQEKRTHRDNLILVDMK